MKGKSQILLQVIVLIGAFVTIPLIVLQEQGVRSIWLDAADWLVWAAFLADFASGWVTARDRRAFAAAKRVDLAVIALSFPLLPNLLQLARVTRLLRVARLLRLLGVTSRGMDALGRVLGRGGLAYMAGACAVVVIAGGGSIALLEPETVKSGFWNGVWWAVVTATTVGYGDISPQTVWGRLVAVLVMMTGVGLTSTLAASVAAYFVSQESNADLRSISKQLERIEKQLEAMSASQNSGMNQRSATSG